MQPYPPVATMTLAQLVDRARNLTRDGRRRLLGITGPPGAGKSSLATVLVEALAPAAALVGMDGFHLSNAELDRLSRRERKGSPDTFDVDGYVALLNRLRDQRTEVIYAPAFNRGLEEPIGSSVPVSRETPLIVTEGNYLLADVGGWEAVREAVDEIWYLEVSHDVLASRLIGRHQSFGKSHAEAQTWTHEVDLHNAELIRSTRARADLVVKVSDTSLPSSHDDRRGKPLLRGE